MRTAYNSLTETDKENIGLSGSNKGFENFLTIIGEGIDKEAVMTIEDPLMATIINKDGLFIIGNQAYKITYDRLIKANNYEKVALKELGQYESSDLNNGIEVFEVKQEKKSVNTYSDSTLQGREVTCIKRVLAWRLVLLYEKICRANMDC
jgi:hypothetical protein